MIPREIELSFPKFKLEEKYDLKPVLRSMGMTDVFDEGKADFSGMLTNNEGRADLSETSTNNGSVISEVVHKSFVEISEEGTEAAAELSFPKFKLEEKYDLKSVLRSMGMTDAFDEGKADFSRRSTNNDLVISEVVHKSFAEISEDSTEVPAATGVIMGIKSVALATEFKIDHPFIFIVKDRSKNSIMFMGRYSSP